MRKAYEAYQRGAITIEEYLRFRHLKNLLFGDSMFVFQDDRPEWSEYNNLLKKIL